MNPDHPSHEKYQPKSIVNLILIGFLLIAGYFLILEHKAHLGGVLYLLPYLLLLACPLMHVFMHHGHGGHGGHPSPKDNREEQK